MGRWGEGPFCPRPRVSAGAGTGAARRPGHGLRPQGIPVTRRRGGRWGGGQRLCPAGHPREGIAVSSSPSLPAGSATTSTPSPVVSGQAGVALVPAAFTGLVIMALGLAWFLGPTSLPPHVARGHPQGPSFWKALCWAHGQRGRAEGETHSGSTHPIPPGRGGQLLGRVRAILLPALGWGSCTAGGHEELRLCKWPPSPPCQGLGQPRHRPHTHQRPPLWTPSQGETATGAGGGGQDPGRADRRPTPPTSG